MLNAKTRPHTRLVSRSFLQCAAIFTAAFTLGLGTAFVARLGARTPEPVVAALDTQTPVTAPAALPEAPPDAALSTSAAASLPAADPALALVGFEPLAPIATPAPAIERDRIYTSGVIARGESLAYALAQQNIDRETIHKLTSELARHFDFRRTQPGHSYRLAQDAEGRVVEFRYSTSPMEGYTLVLEGDHYVVHRNELQLEPREVRIAGVVTTSLHDAIKALGESPQLASDFADIFAWDIDFTRSVRPGDEFRILYERLYFTDDAAARATCGPGRILAAQYNGTAGAYSAIYYESQPGQGAYYHPDGSSVERQFLQAPVRFARISSTYTNESFHPILRITRPHQGIDYAAPVGTPVWSVADGRVIYAGYAGGFGNLVKIRHARGYVSYYGHLSRFGGGLKVGDHVRQKQVIGYVGSTGLSTGPHVCFRIAEGWALRQPGSAAQPAGDSVSAQHRPDFLAFRDSLLAGSSRSLVPMDEAL